VIAYDATSRLLDVLRFAEFGIAALAAALTGVPTREEIDSFGAPPTAPSPWEELLVFWGLKNNG
jgi:hypothetical protein